MRIGKKADGTEVRVRDREGGGANIAFIKNGEVIHVALTGNKRETERVLHDVKFQPIPPPSPGRGGSDDERRS